MVNKELFQEWIGHPVTRELLEAVKERIEEAKEVLVLSDDPEYDRILKGMVRGYNEVLEWQPEVVDAEIHREESRSPSFD